MDIRKTDSKGRISLGNPGTHYRVERLSGQRVQLSPIFDPVEFVPTPATGDSQEYLRSFGLDPMLISREGTDEQGYNEFVSDSKGKPVITLSQRITQRKPWPEGFDWNEFLSLNGVPI